MLGQLNELPAIKEEEVIYETTVEVEGRDEVSTPLSLLV